ncbi:MAG: hypothetical protein AB1656_16875 [Candidatus Omnitrophota bacterium]
MRMVQRFLLAGSLLPLLIYGGLAKAAQMYEGPISADFREWARNAVEKSNDAEAVNKALDDLVKYSNTPDENSQALASVEALLGNVDANSYLFSQASLTKAKFLKRLGRGGEAIAIFNDGIARHWKNALLRYSESLIESGELADACTLEYRRVVAEEPYAFYRGEQEDFFIFITLLNMMKKDNAGAKAMELVYPQLQPSAKHPQAQKIAQALCLANDGSYAEAVNALQEADAELAQGRETREDKSLDEYRNVPLYLTYDRFGMGDSIAAGEDFAEFMKRNAGDWKYIYHRAMRAVRDLAMDVHHDLSKAQVITKQLLNSDMIMNEEIKAQFSDSDIAGLYDMHHQSFAWGGELDKAAEICKIVMDNYFPQTLAGADCAMNWARYISSHDKKVDEAEQILLRILEQSPFPEIRPWTYHSLAEIAFSKKQPYIALNYISEVLNLVPKDAKGAVIRCREITLELKDEILKLLANSRKSP